MLTVLFSWILISIIFLSLGDFFIFLFNKLARREESYSVIDTFILGLFFFLIPLSITSLWLPTNHIMLLAYLLISIVYWLVRFNRFKSILQLGRGMINHLTFLQRSVILITVLSLAFYAVWSAMIFDAAFYHHQFVRWNEEFSVVPGLANLESRFGFNSNYLLLSAPFTLQFIFGEPVYFIQSLLSAYIACWILLYTINSKYNIKGFILLLLYLLFFSFLIHELHDSSTDAIPALISFYIACRYILYPKELTKSYLLPVFVPIALVTFKLSIAAFALLSLYVCYVIIKRKEYKVLSVLVLFGVLIIAPWLIRNVIISGYLIYPLYEINLFSYDWKVPEFVAKIEKDAITSYARYVFKDFVTFGFFFRVGSIMRHKMWFINDLIIMFLYLTSILSLPLVFYSYIKDKKKEIGLYVVYVALVLAIIFWAISAPDFRFISGVMYAMLFLVIVVLLSTKEKNLTRVGKYLITVFALICLLTSVKRTFNHYHKLKEHPGTYSRSVIWYKQYSAEAQEIEPIRFDSVLCNGVKFYLSLDEMGKSYDKLPASVQVSKDSMKAKNLPLDAIEMRGKTLQEGFRPIKGVEKGWWR